MRRTWSSLVEELSHFSAELRRRRVYRAAVAYVVVGLGVLGAAELILDPLGLEAVRTIVVVLVLLGFPIALVLAWAHDIRPEESSATDPIGEAAGFRQEIQFCRTSDGVGIAYSVIGSGHPLVRVLGYFTHLEQEWRWPELRFFWERLAEHFTLIRYDGRGIGMSDPWPEDFTEETRQRDLEAVLSATGVESAALLGVSEGGWTAASFALQNPDRVSHLVFYGCYSRGLVARSNYDSEEDEALMTLMRKGWGRSDPTFRRVFADDFFSPDADPHLLAHFDELQRSASDGDTAVRYTTAIHRGRGDGREMFQSIRTPSLVLHRRGDRVVSFEEGRRLAALIPDARFHPLSGQDHYFPLDRQSAVEVATQITHFVRGDASSRDGG